MKDFITKFKKYNPFALYSAKAELKSEVSNSYLTWIWWILDPLLFMLVYVFMVDIIFKSNEEKLPVFVMSGLLLWNFFNKNVMLSVKIIIGNKSIISQKYIPKYMLVIQKIYVNFIKFLISIGILIILAIFYKVQLSFNIIYSIPLLILLLIISFGISNVFAHFGVFIEDLANIVQVLLRLIFYLSGIFYSISDKLPSNLYNIFIKVNPMAYIIEDFRNIFMYQKTLDIKLYFYWLFIAIIISVLSIKLINKHENSYAKVK